MMARRLLVGVGAVCALAVWSWCRPDGQHAHARPADPVYAAEAAGDHGGTYDEAAARYRTGQSLHWRQVVIGNR